MGFLPGFCGFGMLILLVALGYSCILLLRKLLIIWLLDGFLIALIFQFQFFQLIFRGCFFLLLYI